MKKKFYFNSIWYSAIYILIAMVLLSFIVLGSFADDVHSGLIFVLTILSICLLAILFWIGFSLSMRIQIDYDKKELYIRHPYLIKKMRFEEILNIQIIDYNQVSFDFIIVTNNGTKKLSYSKYYKKRATEKIITKVNDLKTDLINISHRKY